MELGYDLGFFSERGNFGTVPDQNTYFAEISQFKFRRKFRKIIRKISLNTPSKEEIDVLLGITSVLDQLDCRTEFISGIKLLIRRYQLFFNRLTEIELKNEIFDKYFEKYQDNNRFLDLFSYSVTNKENVFYIMGSNALRDAEYTKALLYFKKCLKYHQNGGDNFVHIKCLKKVVEINRMARNLEYHFVESMKKIDFPTKIYLC